MKAAKIFMFLGMSTVTVLFFYVVIANGTPQEKHAIEQEEPIVYDYSQTWYKYKKGYGTLFIDPKTGERGVQITEKELETLRMAEKN